MQEAIYDGAGAGRRAATHAAVAAALEERAGPDPAELAHHFLAAGERDKGVEYSVATASRAIERLAYEDAVAHYGNALEALGDADEPRRCGLLLGLADAHARAGDTPTSKLVYREAAALAEQLSLPEQLAEAAVGYGGRLIWEVSRDDPDVLALLERALAQIGAADSPCACGCWLASAGARCATTTTRPGGARSRARRWRWPAAWETRPRSPTRSTATSRRTTRPTTRRARSSSQGS